MAVVRVLLVCASHASHECTFPKQFPQLGFDAAFVPVTAVSRSLCLNINLSKNQNNVKTQGPEFFGVQMEMIRRCELELNDIPNHTSSSRHCLAF